MTTKKLCKITIIVLLINQIYAFGYKNITNWVDCRDAYINGFPPEFAIDLCQQKASWSFEEPSEPKRYTVYDLVFCPASKDGNCDRSGNNAWKTISNKPIMCDMYAFYESVCAETAASDQTCYEMVNGCTEIIHEASVTVGYQASVSFMIFEVGIGVEVGYNFKHITKECYERSTNIDAKKGDVCFKYVGYTALMCDIRRNDVVPGNFQSLSDAHIPPIEGKTYDFPYVKDKVGPKTVGTCYQTRTRNTSARTVQNAFNYPKAMTPYCECLAKPLS